MLRRCQDRRVRSEGPGDAGKRGKGFGLKRLRNVAAIGVVAFLMTGCLFNLTGFSLLDSSLAPGSSTTARFTVQPFSTESFRAYQFILVGVDDAAAATTAKATWGANGNFRGPATMDPVAGFAETLDSNGGCGGLGMDFGTVVSQLTWRGYVTPFQVNNKGQVSKRATVDVVLKAKPGAVSDQNVAVMGITGMWDDDGDGVVEDSDTFICLGNATTSLYIT